MANNANSNNRVARMKDRLQKERAARLKEREQLKAERAKVKELEKRPTQETIDKRFGELQGKVRGRAWRDAFDAAAKDAKVKPQHVGDLYELAKLALDKDEPDAKAVKDRLGELLKDRAWAVESEEPGDDGNDQDDHKPAPKAEEKPAKLPKDENAGRGRASGAAGHFNVKRSQLSDKNWMRKNQAAYAKAVKEETVNLIG